MGDSPLPSFRYLRIFEAVARLESVSRASTEIHLSQPAVTQAIARLEHAVGATLFERRHTGTYLTEHGQILLTRATRLFEQLESALAEFGSRAAKPLRVSAASMVGKITRTQIRSVAAIARGGSLAQAAQASGISQITLHRSVRALEETLGAPLYRHTAQGVIATRAASELARRMMLATREIECALEELQTARGIEAGRIAVGAQPLGSSILTGSVVNRLIEKYPETRVRIISDAYDTLLHELRTGNIDFIVGLLRNPAPARDVSEELLFLDPYVVVVRQGHPLTRLKTVTQDELGAYSWVVPARGAIRRAAFERLFAGMTHAPRANIETYSLAAMRAILAGSDHVTLLTRYEMLFEERAGLLASLPFGPLDPEGAVGVSTRSNWLPTRLQTDFLALVREQVASLATGTARRSGRKLQVVG